MNVSIHQANDECLQRIGLSDLIFLITQNKEEREWAEHVLK